MILYFLAVDHGWEMFELYPWLCTLNIIACFVYTILMIYLTVYASLLNLKKQNKEIQDMSAFEIYTLISTLIMIPINIFA